jgi:hypothetical protein
MGNPRIKTIHQKRLPPDSTEEPEVQEAQAEADGGIEQ